LAGKPQERLIIRAPARQLRNIGGRPDRAAAEDTLAVDKEREVFAIRTAVDVDAPEAGAAERIFLAGGNQRQIVETWRAVRMRPPGLNVGQLEDSRIMIFADLLERLFHAAAAQQHCRVFCIVMQGNAQPAGAAFLQYRADADIVDRFGIALHQ
jgi:hypothetical protein